jgi:hypothetical protein
MWRGAAMPAFDVARRWKGRVVLDREGNKLGSVPDVFDDAENDELGWVLLGAAGTRRMRRTPPPSPSSGPPASVGR